MPNLMVVGPEFYRTWVDVAFRRDPWERARLLFNAGYRGKDLH